MTEKDINRWNDTITPREKDKPWVLGAGGSWDLKNVEPIPDEMLAELAQRYHYAGTPWNCRSMPLTPADREYMFLIYYSMQGLVARLRIAEQKAAESLAAPAVANAAKTDDLPPLPDPTIEGTVIHPELKICYLAPVHFTADQMHVYARAAIAATAPNTAVMLKWEPLTKAGQVKKGDYVRFDLCGESKTHQVALMLNPGTDKEEIIYHRRNNWYLITSMSVKGEGSQKNVEILPVSAFVAAHAGQGAKGADHG